MHNETVQATLRNTYILPEPALDYKVTGEDIAAGLTSAHVRALWYADRGIAVIPARKDDSKRPAIPWKEYQHRRPTSAELARWFLDEGYEELLIMTGDVSRGRRDRLRHSGGLRARSRAIPVSVVGPKRARRASLIPNKRHADLQRRAR